MIGGQTADRATGQGSPPGMSKMEEHNIILATIVNMLPTAKVLRGWKGISGWFVLIEFPEPGGRGPSTMMRWEKEKDMPVFRRGNNVYSHPAYLLAWLFQHQERNDFYPKRVAARAKRLEQRATKREMNLSEQQGEVTHVFN